MIYTIALCRIISTYGTAFGVSPVFWIIGKICAQKSMFELGSIVRFALDVHSIRQSCPVYEVLRLSIYKGTLNCPTRPLHGNKGAPGLPISRAFVSGEKLTFPARTWNNYSYNMYVHQRSTWRVASHSPNAIKRGQPLQKMRLSLMSGCFLITLACHVREV